MAMKRVQGFTLVEMMVAIAIMAVLVAVAIPNFQAMISNNRITTVSNLLLDSLAMARHEAITRSTDVEIVANNGNWKEGWSVLAKSYNADGTEITPAETVATYEPPHATIVITGIPTDTGGAHPAEDSSSSPPLTLQFNRQGRIALLDGEAIVGSSSISICDERANESGRTITLAPIGRVAAAPITCQ